jgi:hypothetical protein
MEAKTVLTIIGLDRQVKAATSQFYNTAVASNVYDPVLGHLFGEMELTVTDLLLIAILSEVHTLVTGPTSRGKTDLIKLICQGIFGNDGWFLLRLNPHLTEDTFANIDMKKLAEGVLRDAISPAPFLSLPCTILDETNRTPAALTNILLGFCDGRIELKCGLKQDVGYQDKDPNGRNLCYQFGSKDNSVRQCSDALGRDRRYHFIVGTMNEGKEYTGVFKMDSAFRRRYTLEIPFGELRATPSDLVNIVEYRSGHATLEDYSSTVDKVIEVRDDIIKLTLDPLAKVYLIYLGNVGRCPYSPTGFHPEHASQELCSRVQCRVQKVADSFCPSVGGLSEGLLIFLKRVSCGLAALRAARTVQAVAKLCETTKDNEQLDKLREFADSNASGRKLSNAVIGKYLETIVVTVGDIKAMVPFVGLGGKVWIAEEYVAKHFSGSGLLAMREYARLTYAGLENFFREHQTLLRQLPSGNGALEKLTQRLEHAERFNDPFIRHTIEPLLARYSRRNRSPEEVAEDIKASEVVRSCAFDLVQ